MALAEQIARGQRTLRAMCGAGPTAVVAAPYRLCPIGAHIDHQGGPVLGLGIDRFTTLVFRPADGPHCRLRSANFDPDVVVDLTAPAAHDASWGRYPRAAALALADRLPAAPRGIVGAVEGALPGGGLSSSASLLLAHLRALAHVNGIALSDGELVRRCRHAENAHVGVRSGILDPATIVAARRDALIAIDTIAETWETVPPGPGLDDARFVVAYTGLPRALADTGFNDRVAECHEAARRLGAMTGMPATRLGDLGDSVFARLLGHLPARLRRRARHFAGERARVRDGVAAWRRGDAVAFGALMTASCTSSIDNFEVGAPPLVAMHELLQREPGVYGSRFSGAGFGGCVVALAAADRVTATCARVAEAFGARHPELGDAMRVFPVDIEDGLRLTEVEP